MLTTSLTQMTLLQKHKRKYREPERGRISGTKWNISDVAAGTLENNIINIR